MPWIRTIAVSSLLLVAAAGCSNKSELNAKCEKPGAVEYPKPKGMMTITTDAGTQQIAFEANVCAIDLTDSVLLSGLGAGVGHDDIYWLELDYLFEKTYDLNGGFSIDVGKDSRVGPRTAHWISEENTGELKVTITGSQVEQSGSLVDTLNRETVGEFKLTVDCKP